MTLSIVVADDHAPFRRSLRAWLDQQAGLSVIDEVGSGEQAVEAMATLAAHRRLPDVLILDLDMRGLGGLGAARRILSSHPHAGILILSWSDDQPFVDAAGRAGTRGYVLKDDPPPELLTAIHEVAAGRTYVSRTLRDAA